MPFLSVLSIFTAQNFMKKRFTCFLLWLSALSIINRSIDVEDTVIVENKNREQAYEFIEIESITEYLLQATSHESLPDNKQTDSQAQAKKLMSVDFSLPEKKVRPLNIPEPQQSFNRLLSSQDQQLPAGYIQLFTPPPDLS